MSILISPIGLLSFLCFFLATATNHAGAEEFKGLPYKLDGASQLFTVSLAVDGSKSGEALYKSSHCKGLVLSKRQILSNYHCAVEKDRKTPLKSLVIQTFPFETSKAINVIDRQLNTMFTAPLNADGAPADLVILDTDEDVLPAGTNSGKLKPLDFPGIESGDKTYDLCGIVTHRQFEEDDPSFWQPVLLPISLTPRNKEDEAFLLRLKQSREINGYAPSTSDTTVAFSYVPLSRGESGSPVLCRDKNNHFVFVGLLKGIAEDKGPIQAIAIQSLTGYEKWIDQFRKN